MARKKQDGFLSGLELLANSVLSIATAAKKHIDKGNHDSYLRSKYDTETYMRMTHIRMWEGMSSIELSDSLGSPHGIDRKLLATRKREIWKYYPRGVNRYGLRITLDDEVVVGWDSKE